LASPDFVTPDWSEPLDIEPLLEACTPAHRLKGLFFDAAQKVAARAGLSVPMARYMAFKEYPAEDYVRLVGGWVSTQRLSVPPRQLIRMIGWEAFPAFRSTVAGKVILAAAGGTVEDLIGSSGRAYAISISSGSLVPRVGTKRAELEIRGIPTFADSFHVGVFEGVLRAYEHEGTVRVRRHSPVDVDLLLEWP